MGLKGVYNIDRGLEGVYNIDSITDSSIIDEMGLLDLPAPRTPGVWP
jgi:hypothetical protein